MEQTLKTIRNTVGLTQTQVAEKAGITTRGYQRYEAKKGTNNYREPAVTTAIRIADALGVKDLRDLWQVTP